MLKVRSPREGEGSEGAPGTSSVYWELAPLTIVGHISIPYLQHQVDPTSSSPDLFHSLTVGHPRCTFSIDLHQLVRHLKEETFHDIRGTKVSVQHCMERCGGCGFESRLGSFLCGAAMLSMSICGFGPQPQLVLHSVALTHDSGDSIQIS